MVVTLREFAADIFQVPADEAVKRLVVFRLYIYCIILVENYRQFFVTFYYGMRNEPRFAARLLLFIPFGMNFPSLE